MILSFLLQKIEIIKKIEIINIIEISTHFGFEMDQIIRYFINIKVLNGNSKYSDVFVEIVRNIYINPNSATNVFCPQNKMDG